MDKSKKNFKSSLDAFGDDSGSLQAAIFRLAKERGFFETVFNAVDEGILVVDRKLRIRYANRAANEMLALPEDTSRFPVSRLLKGIDWSCVLNPDADNWSRLSRQELELLYPEHRYVQFYLVPLPEDPNLAAIMLRDVTESRDKTMSEMENQTVEAISLLAAGVAHEIGNPLNNIYMNLQLLENDLSDNEAVSEENLNELRICQSEIERLDSIVKRFLSALRTGKCKYAPVNLPELIVNVLNSMRPEIESRKVEVKCNFAEKLPTINGDSAQLQQAVYNIVRNAVQAMTNGGILEIYGYRRDDQLIIDFADTGSGVDAKALGAMFNAFKSTKSGGNGIGTMIIERVCREHGAEFGIVSEPDHGSVFQLRFPLAISRVPLLPQPEK